MGLSTLLQLVLCGITTAIDLVGTKGCTASACVFANPWLRFGTGTQTSINTQGLFVQPFYFSSLTNAWYKLTYSNYPLDTAIGTGTGGPNWSGSTVVDLYSLSPSGSINDYSGFTVTSSDSSTSTGYGRIVTNRTFTINSQNIIMQNIFSLGVNDTFVKINNRLYNNGNTVINNVYIWVGTRDDYVGTTDSNMKTRGNIVNGQFAPLTAVGQQSYAIMITNPTEGVLFYSETNGVNTVFDRCCAFSNSYNLNPATASIATAASTDGSYAAVLPLGNIPVGGSADITWYYAAGAISSLSNVVQNVAVAQQEEASPTGTALSTVSETSTSSESPTVTATETSTPSWTTSETASNSASESATETNTQTSSKSGSQSGTQTASKSGTQTASKSGTQTASKSGTQTVSQTSSQSASQTASKTASNSASESGSQTASETGSETASSSASETASETPSETGSETSSETSSETASNTASKSSTQTPSNTNTQTPSRTNTKSSTQTSSRTSSQTASISAESTTTPLYYITYYASTTQSPVQTPSISPTYMMTMYPSIKVTPTHTASPLYMQIYYPSISSSPKPQTIVVEDKTNYSVQIILGGTAIGTAVVAGIGYALSKFIKSHNTTKQNNEEDIKKKIRDILNKLQEESKQNQCDMCKLHTNEIESYVYELFNVIKR
jgi:hypothetical protein